MYLNLFMDFPFIDLTNAKLRMERLTEYLAPLKNSYLKKEKLLLAFCSFSLYCKCSVFAPDIHIFVFLMLILYSNW